MEENQHVNALKDYIKDNLSSNFYLNDKDLGTRCLTRHSILERILTKFIFQYRSTDFGLNNILTYFKEQSESNESSLDNLFASVKDFFLEAIKQTKNNESLKFYSKVIEQIVSYPKLFQNNHYQEFTLDNAIKIESLLKEHIEANLFGLHNTKKWDDNYFNEAYIKKETERPFFEYSVSVLSTLFGIMKKLEIQNLSCNDGELLNTDNGMISEKKYSAYLKAYKKVNYQYQNLVEYFIQSHVSLITQELYNQESVVNNYEIENKLCLSLFLIKKIVKDYSFYFSRQELENILTALKKYKE